MKIIKETVGSGLTVILAPVAGTKTVTGVFAVRAGWKYETPENHGIAHFLEHMAFKGTKNRPTTLDIAKEVEGRGGQWNAGTSEEMTNYWIKIPCQHTEVACRVLSDMLLNSLLKSEEIEKEKGTIIQELRMYHDMPNYYISMIAWPKLLYGDQPAGRLCIGTEEKLKAMNRNHFVGFLDGLYTDENSVFVLAGNIPEKDRTLAMINNLFYGIREGQPKISKPPVIEAQKKPALFLEARDIQQSRIILGVRAYSISHPKKYALNVLKTVLGGNMSSRMFIEVREKRGLSYDVSTNDDFQTDVGILFTSAGVDKEKVLEAIKVIMEQYQKICDERVSEEELRRAKDYINGSRQMYLESSNTIAHILATQWALQGKIIPLKERDKKIQAVTAEDVQNVAQEIFVNKGLNLAIVGPHAGMEDEFLKILKF